MVIRHLVNKKDEGEGMIHTRAEHRTGGSGVLSCPVGQDAFFIFVLSCRPPGRREEAGQDKKSYPVLISDSHTASELGCRCHGHLSQTHQGPAVGATQLLTRVC